MLKHLSILIGIGTACLAIPATPTFAHAEPTVSTIHRLCAEIGLSPGAYDFFFCTQSLAASAGIPPGQAAARDSIDPSLHAYGDFYHTDWRRSEQHACAGLGLPAGSQRFTECVVNLDTALTSLMHLDPR